MRATKIVDGPLLSKEDCASGVKPSRGSCPLCICITWIPYIVGDEEERRKEGRKSRGKEEGRERTRAQGDGERMDDNSDRSSGTRETQTVGVEKRKGKRHEG